MERCILLRLKVATKEDFANEDGSKKLGTLFFYESVKGIIENDPKYFTDSTDMKTFKELYSTQQVYVLANPNDKCCIEEMEIEETNK